MQGRDGEKKFPKLELSLACITEISSKISQREESEMIMYTIGKPLILQLS